MEQTPIRNKLVLKRRSLTIPPSPQMQKLGYGTGVTVYKLERSENRSPWVLKKISRQIQRKYTEEMNTRLAFEATILRTLKHPNIVGFRAVLQEMDGRKCIAMEHCTISLGDLIEQRVDDGNNVPFEAKKITRVLCDVADGLKYLHHNALVLHCDIKSYNILVKNNFQICKICDFGVSMPLKNDGTLDYAKVGPEAEYVGTGSWCAPEILQVGQIITVKADIFAFGLCLWEMIALEPPYSNEAVDCSIMDETCEGSDSDDKENKDVSSANTSIAIRQRPKVPCEYMDDSYLPILQVYYLCTEQDYKRRPSANDLCIIIAECINNVSTIHDNAKD